MQSSFPRRRTRRAPSHRSPNARRHRVFVGIDTGGTFTDIVYLDGDRAGSYKVPSTPLNPARAVLEGLRHLFGERALHRLTYGTTVATNAMLQRRGARVALITTSGFEDVLEIGRQNRPELYDLHPRRTEPLVPASRRFGVQERVLYDGRIELALDDETLLTLPATLRRSRAQSIAVCLLHAYANPAHELAIAAALADLGLPITVSHALSPLAGEYERSSTVAANAYVRPVMEGHLAAIANGAHTKRLLVMQSNGGVIGARIAATEPVRTMLSGPAGGVAAAFRCARAAGLDRIVTLDMGGTSTDVALLEDGLPRKPETFIAGVPISSPSIDIHTVGAGGGSIAYVDEGGALNVGPESAGADPGPACYGKGDTPTVTDANVVLGRLRPEAFLGGDMRLDAERGRHALSSLVRAMRQRTPEEAAEGVVRVVEGTMERAIRVITVERGQDPRTCALMTFGGAAGLHACGLADALDMRAIIVPADPGLLSAWGVMEGEVVRDRRHALRALDPSFARLDSKSRPLAAAALRDVLREGIVARHVRVERWVAMRYRGQSIELEVKLDPDFRTAFDRAHQNRFHSCDPARSIEVTGVRATAFGTSPVPPRAPLRTTRSTPSHTKTTAWIDGCFRGTRIYARDALDRGARIDGPAIVTEYSSTTLVAPGWRAELDRNSNIVMRRRTRKSSGRA